MADNNNTPQYTQPLDDLPTKEEFIEKPYYDNDPSPAIQYPNNNNFSHYQNTNNIQAQYYNLPPSGSVQPYNQVYRNQVSNYSSPAYYNNNYNKDNNNNKSNNYNNIQFKQRNGNSCDNPKIILTISIILIIVFIVDIGSLIGLGYFNILIFGDSLLIFIIGLLFLILTLKGISVKHVCFGFLSIIVWFGGFALRGIGITYIENDIGSSTPLIPIEVVIMIVRTFALFACIPYTCNAK